MKKEHNFTWYHRKLNEDNQHLLINYKKKLLFDGVNNRTIHQYLKQLENWFIYLQEKDVTPLEATVEMVEDYLNTFDVSESRMSVIVSILTGYYKHLKRRGYVKEDIMKIYKKNSNK